MVAMSQEDHMMVLHLVMKQISKMKSSNRRMKDMVLLKTPLRVMKMTSKLMLSKESPG